MVSMITSRRGARDQSPSDLLEWPSSSEFGTAKYRGGRPLRSSTLHILCEGFEFLYLNHVDFPYSLE